RPTSTPATSNRAASTMAVRRLLSTGPTVETRSEEGPSFGGVGCWSTSLDVRGTGARCPPTAGCPTRRPVAIGDDRRMIQGLTIGGRCAGLLLGARTGSQAWRRRPTSEAQMVGAIVVEAALLVQTVIAVV